MKLVGIDGSQLLGFLAGLGTLALVNAHAKHRGGPGPRLSFSRDGLAALQVSVETTDDLVAILYERLQCLRPFYGQRLANQKNPSDLTASEFGKLARTSDRDQADLLAGLACPLGDDGSSTESSLCAANGASHQSLIQSIRDVLVLIEPAHLEAALFSAWTRSYAVPDDKRKKLGLGARNPTLRLEPADERLYALRLTNPTTTKDFKTELGAQALAIPAFAMLPVVPREPPVAVSSKRAGNRIAFSWCLWEVPATYATVRSLLFTGPGDPRTMRARGAFAAFSCDRVTGEKGKLSFAPAVGLW